jgi:hypothetical protein
MIPPYRGIYARKTKNITPLTDGKIPTILEKRERGMARLLKIGHCKIFSGEPPIKQASLWRTLGWRSETAALWRL